MFVIATVTFIMNVTITFIAVIVFVNVIRMFSMLVLLCVSHFAVQRVDKYKF